MTDWTEILVAGSGDAVDELVADADPQRLFRGEDLALHAGSFTERCLELLGAKTHHLLYAPADEARELVKRIEADPDLRLEQLRQVARASFAFAAEAYSHPAAAKIKKILHGDLPAGVSLIDCKDFEETDPEAGGVELYAPAHHYTYHASGRFTGVPPGIFELYRRIHDIDFVKEEELEVEGREVEGLGA
jgi:hypothetical protein